MLSNTMGYGNCKSWELVWGLPCIILVLISHTFETM